MLDYAIQNPQEAYSQWLPMAKAARLRCLDIGERPDLDGSVVGRGSFFAAGNLAVNYAGCRIRSNLICTKNWLTLASVLEILPDFFDKFVGLVFGVKNLIDLRKL